MLTLSSVLVEKEEAISSISSELAELQNKQGYNLHQHYLPSKSKHKMDLI
jgi:hypothetical protein